MKSDPRYDLFGWDYAAINPLDAAAVQWYRRWAGATVLELACGTGRLACAMAEAGWDVVAMDVSPTMLDLARVNVGHLPVETRERVMLIDGDMADFDLGREFDTIIIADNSFRELPTRDDLLRCLRCIRRHLMTTGRLLVTERRFDPADYPDGRRTFDWSTPRTHPTTGEQVCRRVAVRLAEGGARLRGTMTYRTLHADGTGTLQDCLFESLALTEADYLALFAEAGLTTRTFADYNEQVDHPDGAVLCFVCEPRG